MYVRTYDINPNEETDVIFDEAIECEAVDLQFIYKARTAIELGKSVFYSSWW